jgi:hypothetical protein
MFFHKTTWSINGAGRMASFLQGLRAQLRDVPEATAGLCSGAAITENRNHTKPSRTYSFFEKSNLLLQDIMLFIKCYLESMRPFLWVFLRNDSRELGMLYEGGL